MLSGTTVSSMAEENCQAAAAQDQNTHFQQEIAATFTQLTAQIGALSNSFGNASIGRFITPFDGKNSKDFHPWVKQVEKFCKLTDVGAKDVKQRYNLNRIQLTFVKAWLKITSMYQSQALIRCQQLNRVLLTMSQVCKCPIP